VIIAYGADSKTFALPTGTALAVVGGLRWLKNANHRPLIFPIFRSP
jgi:hypothetical protein